MTADERLAWLIERQSGIGSSDAPNLIGVGFQNAAAVYRSKVDPVTPVQAARMPGVLKRGIVLEPLVAAEYREAIGEEIVPAKFARHPVRSWQTSTCDFTRVRDGVPVECKTVAGFGSDWGGSGTDDIPEAYLVQCQHQMGVGGHERIEIAALDVIAWEFRIYGVAFNREFFDWLTAVEQNAWWHIERREPLGEEWEMQWRDEAATMVDKLDSGSRLKLPERYAELLDRRAKYSAIEKEAAQAKREITEELKAAMGPFHRAECGGWKLSKWIVAACHKEYDQDAYVSFRASPTKKGQR